MQWWWWPRANIRESFARDLRCFCKYALSLWARGGTEGRGGNKLVREMPRLRICTGSTFEGAPPSILATVATSSIGHFMRCCRSHHQCEPSTVHCWQKGEDCILQKICDLLWVAAGNVTCRTCRASPALCNPLPHNIITGSHYWRHQRPWKQYQNSNIIAFEGKRFSMFNHSFHRIHRSSSALHLCDVSWQETCETCGNISRKGNCSAEFQQTHLHPTPFQIKRVFGPLHLIWWIEAKYKPSTHQEFRYVRCSDLGKFAHFLPSEPANMALLNIWNSKIWLRKISPKLDRGHCFTKYPQNVIPCKCIVKVTQRFALFWWWWQQG